ncbi:MAG TPA: acyl-CoA carboxylase subunit beta [Solirubrobacterales bacterium]|jgi:acetyl-CoA carboxylase carboxyltransferase component
MASDAITERGGGTPSHLRGDVPRSLAEPRERLEMLCDPGSFRTLRSGVLSRNIEGQPGDGVLVGVGRVSGRPLVCYAEDPSFMGGSLGETHADSIVRALELASSAGTPIVGFVESGGARLQEGHAALAGYGRIFRASVKLSRRVPQISIVAGVSAGGGSYAPALTDFVVMTDEARMFLTGPRVVRWALGEDVSMEELGGPRVQERNGVCQLVADDDEQAVQRVRQLVGFLPQTIGDRPPFAKPVPAPLLDPSPLVPSEARRVYDVRDVARGITDADSLLELGAPWAKNMVTALARIEGQPVGIVANQPRQLGGVIDAAGSEKAALFVNSCNRFGLPLVVLVDTPGFMPGRRQEAAGVIRHGASLLRAFASASVLRLTVVLRKAYGGAVITMNSKDLGADAVFAWPGAEIGIMGASEAVRIVDRRRLEAAGQHDSLHAALTAAYAQEHLIADVAAASGFVDEVIEPAETRERLAWTLTARAGR